MDLTGIFKFAHTIGSTVEQPFRREHINLSVRSHTPLYKEREGLTT